MPHGVPTEAVARLTEPEKEIKPRKTCGQEGCIVKQAKGQEPMARAHVEPRRSTEKARGRLTVGGRGAIPLSAITSPHYRASRPRPGPPPWVLGRSYPNPAGPDPSESASLHQNNKTAIVLSAIRGNVKPRGCVCSRAYHSEKHKGRNHRVSDSSLHSARLIVVWIVSQN